MRRLISMGLLVALALAATPLATADHTSDCPEYTIDLGDESTGAGANEAGQLVVRGGDLYVFVDEFGGVTGSGEYSFSIWFYLESNGEPGPQRHDDYCGTPGTDDGNRDTLWS